MVYPWITLRKWAPIRIDALGLVTFLVAEELNLYIGRLVRSRWLEYMPLLGAFVIAGDRFKDKRPSFNMYNISDGITTTDLSSWFTRWMIAQDFELTRSIVYWEAMGKPQLWWPFHATAGVVSFGLMGMLIAMTVLSRDFYGLANAIAIVISVLVRAQVLQANRSAIDRIVVNSTPFLEKLEQAEADKGTREKPQAVEAGAGTYDKFRSPNVAKVLIVMCDSKVVTMFAPKHLLIPVFVRNPQPHTPWLYDFSRWIGWGAFAIHVLAIGSAELAAQIFTVALLILSTILTCWKVGCDDRAPLTDWVRSSRKSHDKAYECWIGSHLKATIFQWPANVEFEKLGQDDHAWQWKPQTSGQERSTRRQDLYAWLNLTADEEDSMGKWDLLPHNRNEDETWAQDFNAKKELIRGRPPDIQAIKNAIAMRLRRRKFWGGTFIENKSVSDDAEVHFEDGVQARNPLEPTAAQREATTLSSSGMPMSNAVMSTQARQHDGGQHAI